MTSRRLALAVGFLPCTLALACDTAGLGDGPGTDPATDCPALDPSLLGEGTVHGGSIDGIETWTAADSPHLAADTGISIVEGGEVTVEPCAVLQIVGNIAVTSGKLVAQGTENAPITIGPLPGAAPFQRMAVIGAPLDGTSPLSLHHVTITGAEGNFDAATIVLDAPSDEPPIEVDLQSVTIRDAPAGGIIVNNARFTPNSTNIRIVATGSGGDPAALPVTFHEPAQAGSLPSGDYSGNFLDRIGLGRTGVAGNDVRTSDTWHDPGIPYRATDDLIVGGDDLDDTPTVLTLEAGVVIEFAPTTRFWIGAVTPGALVVRGTPDDPVVLKSAADAPAPGDWEGLRIDGTLAAGTDIEHLVIEHAGSDDSAGDFTCLDDGILEQAAVALIGADLGPVLRNTRIAPVPEGVIGIMRAYEALDGGTDYLAPALENVVEDSACPMSAPSGDNFSCSATCSGTSGG